MNVIWWLRQLSRCHLRTNVLMTYLEPVLQLGDKRIIGYEGENAALHGIWQWDDQQAEDGHLKHEQTKDLEV